MVLLRPSRSGLIFFGLCQMIDHMDPSSCQIVVLIKYTRWIYDRGKLSANQGYFSFLTTYECCMVKISSTVTMFLISKWVAEYGSESVFELILEFGYQLLSLFLFSNVYLLAANGDTHSICELFDEVPARNVSNTMLP
ncbi:hypothetical protein MKW92_014593, partial [Papaver armeniacum]